MHNFPYHYSNRPDKDFFSDYFISVFFRPNRLSRRLGYFRIIKHYYALIIIVMLSACSKDPNQISNTYSAYCSASSQTTTGHHFDYNSDPLPLHFRADEFISYKLYYSFDNSKYVLQESKTIRACDFYVFFGARHYFIEMYSQSRMLEIDIQNHLPEPYIVQVRSKCN